MGLAVRKGRRKAGAGKSRAAVGIFIIQLQKEHRNCPQVCEGGGGHGTGEGR